MASNVSMNLNISRLFQRNSVEKLAKRNQRSIVQTCSRRVVSVYPERKPRQIRELTRVKVVDVETVGPLVSTAEDEDNRTPFPLLDSSKNYTHVSPGVCDACARDAGVRGAWVDLLLGQIPSHRSNIQRTAEASTNTIYGVDQQMMLNYWTWEMAYVEYLENARNDASKDSQYSLLEMVEEKERLLRGCGLEDPFQGIKQDENEAALQLYQPIQQELDALQEEQGMEMALQVAVECALAGNLFDAGAAQAVAEVARCDDDECEMPSSDPLRLTQREVFNAHKRIRAQVARPEGSTWRYDSFEKIVERMSERPWKRVVLFLDNAGADALGMLVLARTLIRLGGSGATAALVANGTPALNDITYPELSSFVEAAAQRDPALADLIDEGRLVCLPSGQPSTLLNLNLTGAELNSWVDSNMEEVSDGEDWLLVLDGMGRSLESNWNAGDYLKPGVSALTCAMIKSEINAERLDAQVYDCVVRLNP